MVERREAAPEYDADRQKRTEDHRRRWAAIERGVTTWRRRCGGLPAAEPVDVRHH